MSAKLFRSLEQASHIAGYNAMICIFPDLFTISFLPPNNFCSKIWKQICIEGPFFYYNIVLLWTKTHYRKSLILLMWVRGENYKVNGSSRSKAINEGLGWWFGSLAVNPLLCQLFNMTNLQRSLMIQQEAVTVSLSISSTACRTTHAMSSWR